MIAPQLTLNSFEGPLDLLLYLVKEKRISVFEINILELANQYLLFIKKHARKNLGIASEFLLMATKLVHLKAQALLPNHTEKKKFEKSRDELIKQLAEYKQFQNIKAVLMEKLKNREKVFLKKRSNLSKLRFPQKMTKNNATTEKNRIINILQKVNISNNLLIKKLKILPNEHLSPKKRSQQIKALLKSKGQINFKKLFTCSSLKHFMVTWIAVLDLARQQKIRLKQVEQFNDILVLRGANYGS